MRLPTTSGEGQALLRTLAMEPTSQEARLQSGQFHEGEALLMAYQEVYGVDSLPPAMDHYDVVTVNDAARRELVALYLFGPTDGAQRDLPPLEVDRWSGYLAAARLRQPKSDGFRWSAETWRTKQAAWGIRDRATYERGDQWGDTQVIAMTTLFWPAVFEWLTERTPDGREGHRGRS